MTAPQRITGVFPPMLTPFDEKDAVSYDAFVRNIERWNDHPLSGYLVLGSNSETPFLTEEEKIQLMRLTVAAARPGRILLAGTGCESTAETIRLTNIAARTGFHAALVLTPHFYGNHVTDEALVRHFTAVAEASDIPILIYNVPKYTHRNISVDAVQTLSRHPRIVGMKDSHGDLEQLKRFAAVVPESFTLILGNASILYPAWTIGVRAAILALANCAPAQCVEVTRLFEAGQCEGAERLHTRLVPVNRAVTSTYGIAGLKYASTALGFEGGRTRHPLPRLTPAQEEQLLQILLQAGLLS